MISWRMLDFWPKWSRSRRSKRRKMGRMVMKMVMWSRSTAMMTSDVRAWAMSESMKDQPLHKRKKWRIRLRWRLIRRSILTTWSAMQVSGALGSKRKAIGESRWHTTCTSKEKTWKTSVTRLIDSSRKLSNDSEQSLRHRRALDIIGCLWNIGIQCFLSTGKPTFRYVST